MAEIGTMVSHPKNGNGIVTKTSKDPENVRYKNFVRYESGAMEWMSDDDVAKIAQ